MQPLNPNQAPGGAPYAALPITTFKPSEGNRFNLILANPTILVATVNEKASHRLRSLGEAIDLPVSVLERDELYQFEFKFKLSNELKIDEFVKDRNRVTVSLETDEPNFKAALERFQNDRCIEVFKTDYSPLKAFRPNRDIPGPIKFSFNKSIIGCSYDSFCFKVRFNFAMSAYQGPTYRGPVRLVFRLEALESTVPLYQERHYHDIYIIEPGEALDPQPYTEERKSGFRLSSNHPLNIRYRQLISNWHFHKEMEKRNLKTVEDSEKEYNEANGTLASPSSSSSSSDEAEAEQESLQEVKVVNGKRPMVRKKVAPKARKLHDPSTSGSKKAKFQKSSSSASTSSGCGSTQIHPNCSQESSSSSHSWPPYAQYKKKVLSSKDHPMAAPKRPKLASTHISGSSQLQSNPTRELEVGEPNNPQPDIEVVAPPEAALVAPPPAAALVMPPKPLPQTYCQRKAAIKATKAIDSHFDAEKRQFTPKTGSRKEAKNELVHEMPQCVLCDDRNIERHSICCQNCWKLYHIDCIGISESRLLDYQQKMFQRFICGECNFERKQLKAKKNQAEYGLALTQPNPRGWRFNNERVECPCGKYHREYSELNCNSCKKWYHSTCYGLVHDQPEKKKFLKNFKCHECEDEDGGKKEMLGVMIKKASSEELEGMRKIIEAIEEKYASRLDPFTAVPDPNLYPDYTSFIDWRRPLLQDIKERAQDWSEVDSEHPRLGIVKPIYSLGDFISDFNLMLYNATVYNRRVRESLPLDAQNGEAALGKRVSEHDLLVPELLDCFYKQIQEYFGFDIEEYFRKMEVDDILVLDFEKWFGGEEEEKEEEEGEEGEEVNAAE